MIKAVKRNPKYPDNLVLDGKLIAAGKAVIQESRVQFRLDPKASKKALLDDNDVMSLQVAETNESIRLTRTKADRQSSAGDVWHFSKVSAIVIPYGEDVRTRTP